MNVESISMPRDEALKRLKEYRERYAKIRGKQLATDMARETKAAMDGYEALAEGTPLINLDDVIASAPVDELGRPKLAVARADGKQVRFDWRYGLTRATFDIRPELWRGSVPEKMVQTVEMARESRARNERGGGVDLQGYALVPMIPAKYQPAPSTLKKYSILWEVEQWASTIIRSKPDIDPYLIKHITGSLWAVVAEWDLTPLERAVMTGRRDN